MAVNQLASYNFPDIYYDNLVATATTVKYVSTSGSDTNNGNSIATAYKTIAYAVSANSANTGSITIVILAGTYVEVPITAGSSYATAALTDGNKPRVFVCCPGQVKIQFSDATMSYGPYLANFQNSGSAVYGAIFERNNGGRTANYATALFCASATVGNLEGNFYNCGFTEVNANNTWSLIYDNESSLTSQVNNCTFKFGAAPLSDYTGGSGMTITSSVFNTVAPAGNSVKVSTLASQTVSATYVTTGVTTAGVYSGTYAWNGAITMPAGLYSSAGIFYSGVATTITLRTTGLANGSTVAYTISGVTSAEISGASLTGNFTINNNSGSISITPLRTLLSGSISIISGGYAAMWNISYPVAFTTYVGRPATSVLLTTAPNTVRPVVMDRVIMGATSGALLDLTNNQKTVLNVNRTSTKTGSTAMAATSSATLDANTVQKTIATSAFNSQSGGMIGPRSNTTTTMSGGVMNTYVVQPGGSKQPQEYWM